MVVAYWLRRAVLEVKGLGCEAAFDGRVEGRVAVQDGSRR